MSGEKSTHPKFLISIFERQTRAREKFIFGLFVDDVRTNLKGQNPLIPHTLAEGKNTKKNHGGTHRMLTTAAELTWGGPWGEKFPF